MSLRSLQDALTLTPDAHGRLSADLHGDFSNGPIGSPPEAGFPFGGLVAALAARAMREGLELNAAPLRTLSVQFLSAARYGSPLTFRPRLLRGGRGAAFAQVKAEQGEATEARPIVHATATYGLDMAGVTMRPLVQAPPPLESLDPSRTISGPLAPRFSQYVDYRFDGGPHILTGVPAEAATERLWMRTKDGGPLDELRLCYLLDALYPPAWTALRRPVRMSSVDLRYDVITDPTPENAPDGWAFFEFRMLDYADGWTMDETTVWGADGAPIALSRQRRRLALSRPPKAETPGPEAR